MAQMWMFLTGLFFGNLIAGLCWYSAVRALQRRLWVLVGVSIERRGWTRVTIRRQLDGGTYRHELWPGEWSFPEAREVIER